MKKIRVKAVKGNKEFLVVAKTFKEIKDIFNDYFIVPQNVVNIDDERAKKKIIKNMVDKKNEDLFDLKRIRENVKVEAKDLIPDKKELNVGIPDTKILFDFEPKRIKENKKVKL